MGNFSSVRRATVFLLVFSVALSFSFLGSVLANEFNCNVQRKDSGIGFNGNRSEDIVAKGGPVEVLRIFPVKNWSRYRCRGCYSGRKTGKLFCSCHMDSNKPQFDVAKIYSPSSVGRFGTTVCRYCISVGEKDGYSTMCYCKNINAPDKPAPKAPPKVVKKPIPKKHVTRPATNSLHKIHSHGEYTSVSEDTTIINNYYGSSDGQDEGRFEGETMPSYSDSRPCDPTIGPCSASENSIRAYNKYHEQDIALAVGAK